MDFTLKNKENNRACFNIEITEKNSKRQFKKAYLKNRNKFNIPGLEKEKLQGR